MRNAIAIRSMPARSRSPQWSIVARTPLSAIVALWVVAVAVTANVTAAADPADFLSHSGQHKILRGDSPPGFLGQARLAGRGPVAGYFQPVAISGPEGVQFALAQDGQFLEPRELMQAGLLIGGVYRFQITGIPGYAGAELYPTVEIIDRTYPPPGLATRYPIHIQLDDQDLLAALRGQLVTRVIYLEDPQTAVPLEQTVASTQPLDISEQQDALAVADRFGRPVAIVRIGSVAPPTAPALLPQFFFGYPDWAPIYHPSEQAPQP